MAQDTSKSDSTSGILAKLNRLNKPVSPKRTNSNSPDQNELLAAPQLQPNIQPDMKQVLLNSLSPSATNEYTPMD